MDQSNHCTPAQNAVSDDVVFVPQEMMEALNGIYKTMKEAQRQLHRVAEGMKPIINQ